MTKLWHGAGLVSLLALLAGTAGADDRALVIGNENYSDAADITAADAALDAATALERQGFRVISGSDLTAEDARDVLSEQLAALRTGDRLVILLSGHFARSAGQSWFIGTDASEPDLATVDATALNLATVMEIAATARAGAVLLLGTETRRLPLGVGLDAGIGALQVPPGVTVIRGDALAIATFASRQLSQRGVSLGAMLDQAPGLTADGFLPVTAFRPAAGTTEPLPQPSGGNEDALWRATLAIDTATAYNSYLARYPQGRYATEARAKIAALRDPLAQARAVEDALALTRDERRAIQRGLALLGHDPRGVDGVFGPGSRAAITAWQSRNAVTATGFLTRDQLTTLSAQADRRAVEVEAETAARRAEQERQDQLYWDQTGRAGDEPGLRAYLRRFPDGLYADVATDRLQVFDDAARDRDAAQDRAAWDRARGVHTVAAYREYLTAFPRGAFAAEARTRITALSGDGTPDAAQDRAAWDRARGVHTAAAYREYLTAFPRGAFAAEAQTRITAMTGGLTTDAERAQHEATEAALNLNPLARNLIEGRLAALGLKPGAADGTFDRETRRAIRAFQASRNLPETGYLNQQTMVGLVSGGFLNLGD